MIVKRHILAGALRIAADEYSKDATSISRCVDASLPGHQRTIEQFNSQAIEARKLADDIEQGDTIQLED